MKMRAILIAFIVSACTNAFANPRLRLEATDVSLIALLANPERNEGRIIRVIGFLSSAETQEISIYPWREERRLFDASNEITLTAPAEVALVQRLSELDASLVLIEGRFTAKRKGHLALSAGSIEEIRRVDVWDPADVCDVIRNGIHGFISRGIAGPEDPEVLRLKRNLEKNGCVETYDCAELQRRTADLTLRQKRIGDHGRSQLLHYTREYDRMKCAAIP